MKQKTKRQKRLIIWRTIQYYWQALKQHKGLSFLGFIVTPVVIITRSVLAPYFLASIIGKISAGIDPENGWQTLIPDAVGFVLCHLLGSELLGNIRVWSVWKSELQCMYDLTMKCFEKVNTQSMSFHNNRFAGSLVSQTNKFVGGFERLMDTIYWQILPLICVIVATVAILAPRVPTFTIGLVAAIVAYIVIAAICYKRVGKLNQETAEAENKQTGQLSDALSNILAVKSYGREAHERRRYANYSKKSYECGIRQMHSVIIRDTYFGIVIISLVALIALFMIFGTKMSVEVATLVLISQYTLSIIGNLWDINGIFRAVNRVFGDAHEMTEILDTPDDVRDRAGAKELVVEKGAIEFNQVRFQHAEAPRPIFDDFTLKVEAGERIGLVGLSGSGKTTLTKLLLRFADVQEGEILIDGQNVSNVRQVSLRQNVAYVPQETALFHRSIAENIAYGRPEATIEEIEHAARLAHVDEFVKDLPQRYDTLVGERGVKLSGGQRQRIAIARAILKNAPILVLDEATSALDSESEALIQDALNRLMKGRTSIVVAHRLSTIAGMDRIVVLDNGKIMEQGSHDELLKHRGAYHHLWSRQSGAFLNKETDEEEYSEEE